MFNLQRAIKKPNLMRNLHPELRWSPKSRVRMAEGHAQRCDLLKQDSKGRNHSTPHPKQSPQLLLAWEHLCSGLRVLVPATVVQQVQTQEQGWRQNWQPKEMMLAMNCLLTALEAPMPEETTPQTMEVREETPPQEADQKVVRLVVQ